MHRAETRPVVIIGAGPTGLTLANLLGRRGVDTVVLEQDEATSDLPRAVSFDDESLRTLQSCGLVDEAYALILQGTGTKYYGRKGRPIAYQRGPVLPVHGHPVKNPFSQPAFESMLLRGLDRFACVDVQFRSTLTAVTGEPEAGALVTVSRPDGSSRQLRARHVVACDGGRSAARELLSVPMKGSSFAEPWLVVDVIDDHHDERYAMHHSDPDRPYVIVAGRDGRCRYEFMVKPGEDPATLTALPEVQRLLAPFRTVRADQLERAVVYTFHALVAERWRVGCVLFAGDAAHMMPPFAGQGLNSGIRDAVNLAWKLAAVRDGTAGEGLLDTYEAERRPHAQASVELSVRLGRLMRPRGRVRGAARELLIRVAMRIPAIHRWVSQGRFKPLAHYGPGSAVAFGEDGAGLVGRQLPQPLVLTEQGDGILLDEALGTGFALIAISPSDRRRPALEHPVWQSISPTVVELMLDDRAPHLGTEMDRSVADIHGMLTDLLGELRGRFLLVRPDRFIAAVLPAHPDDAADLVARALWIDTPT